LKGETYVFPDAAKMVYSDGPGRPPTGSVLLKRQNNEEIRLGDGAFVTIGDEPTLKA